MKEWRINQSVALILPHRFTWKLDEAINCFRFFNAAGVEKLSFAILRSPAQGISTPAARLEWCHVCLIEYLEKEIGPPFSSNVAQIDGDSWLGYQGVTAMGDDLFNVTRYVIGKNEPVAVRLVFRMRRGDAARQILKIVENLSIGV